jgi:hypothetical protein
MAVDFSTICSGLVCEDRIPAVQHSARLGPRLENAVQEAHPPAGTPGLTVMIARNGLWPETGLARYNPVWAR